jgi:hypothetical protein
VAVSFAEAKAIVRAAEESTWTPGTYQIENDGFEDETHYPVVRGAAEAMGDKPDPSYILVPGLETGEIECVVPHLPEVVARLDATLLVSG